MDNPAIVYILIGVIGVILIFAILKMAESLKAIDEKMSKILAALEKKND